MISTQSRLLHSVQHAKRSSSGQSEQLISSATVTHRNVVPKAKAPSRPWDRPAATHAYAVAARERLDHFDEREAERLAEAGLALDPANAPRADLLEVRPKHGPGPGTCTARARTCGAALTLAGTAAIRSRLLTRKARRWSCGRTARRSPHSGGPRRPNTPLRTPCRSRSVSVAVAGRPRRCAASVSRTRPPATCQRPRTRSAGSLHKSQHLPLFSSWAHARLALVLVAMGRLEEATTHVDRALAMGPPLGQFEARVARCVLAVVRRQPNTSEMLQDAVHRATAGSHRASQARLSMLIDSWEAVSSTATHGDR